MAGKKWIAIKEKLMKERLVCDGCGVHPPSHAHHMLFHDTKGYERWLDVEYNAMLVCPACHASGKLSNDKAREQYLYVQAKRYGVKKIREWLTSLPFRQLPHFVVAFIDSHQS